MTRHPAKIAVLSACILTLELALIRQIPAEVKAISYFTNLILMASFFGLGVGCILQRSRSLAWTIPLGLVFVAGFIALTRGLVVHHEAASVHYWLQDIRNIQGEAPAVPLFFAAVVAFVASAVPFIGLGQALARAMDEYPRLIAYGWDILGSVVGTVAFVLLSYFGVPPWCWPILAIVVYIAFYVRTWFWRVANLVAAMAFLWFAFGPHQPRWSPYYYVQHKVEDAGVRVWVNSSFHQFAVDFTDSAVNANSMPKRMLEKFSWPYNTYRELNGGQSPKRVLVLGAGTGNDVSVALRNNAEHITAVEIDPDILEVGRLKNPSQPYSDSRVVAVIDDARHFLSTTEEKFDLVVFGTLDSQTLLSGHSNIRLENYVYTVEAMTEARRILSDTGMVAVYYSVFKNWLYPRIFKTVAEPFDGQCSLKHYDNPFLFNTAIVCSPHTQTLRPVPALAEAAKRELASTDDWPFLYLEQPTIAPVYAKLFGVVACLILLAFFLLRTTHQVTGLHANFLFLGLGFTLVESAAIVRLALVVGSTWVMNAVVFGSVLLTIFFANALVHRQRAPSMNTAWLGVFVGLLLNYFVAPAQLLVLPLVARMFFAALLVAVPVFFAAICFSRLFQRESITGYPLGINLVGAMGGGLLEYSSMLVGMSDVWLIALVVYLLAMLTTRLAHRGTTVEVSG